MLKAVSRNVQHNQHATSTPPQPTETHVAIFASPHKDGRVTRSNDIAALTECARVVLFDENLPRT
jgi:hypothetical protein